AGLSGMEDAQVDLRSGCHGAGQEPQLATVLRWFAVDFDDDVSGLQTSASGRAVRIHIADESPMRLSQFQHFFKIRRDVLNTDSEVSASQLACFDDLIQHGSDHIAGNGEPDAHIPTARAEYGGIYSDQLTAHIHQRSSRVPGVNGCISLDEVFIVFDAKAAAAHRADDTHGHGSANSERLADRG